MLNRLAAYSSSALELAKNQIEAYGTFLPFGGILTNDGQIEQIVYHDPDAESIDPRAHATIIQDIIGKKYQQANCELVQMAFDGVMHLKTGDIDAVNVRVSHRPTNTHKLFSYPYRINNGKVEFIDTENPVVNNV